MDNQAEVREFLTTRRARLGPRDVGLPDVGRRRVPGLRRGEVAALAGVSIEYYSRLERGVLAGASPSVLDSIARALQLSDAERSHLFHLAQTAEGTIGMLRPRRASGRSWSPSPTLSWVLEQFSAPAIVRNGRMDLLASNALGRAMHSALYERATSGVPNFARFTFLDPEGRDFYPDWDLAASTCVSILRTEAGRDPHDPLMHDLVGRAVDAERRVPPALEPARRTSARGRHEDLPPRGRRRARAGLREPRHGLRPRADPHAVRRRAGFGDRRGPGAARVLGGVERGGRCGVDPEQLNEGSLSRPRDCGVRRCARSVGGRTYVRTMKTSTPSPEQQEDVPQRATAWARARGGLGADVGRRRRTARWARGADLDPRPRRWRDLGAPPFRTAYGVAGRGRADGGGHALGRPAPAAHAGARRGRPGLRLGLRRDLPSPRRLRHRHRGHDVGARRDGRGRGRRRGWAREGGGEGKQSRHEAARDRPGAARHRGRAAVPGRGRLPGPGVRGHRARDDAADERDRRAQLPRPGAGVPRPAAPHLASGPRRRRAGVEGPPDRQADPAPQRRGGALRRPVPPPGRRADRDRADHAGRRGRGPALRPRPGGRSGREGCRATGGLGRPRPRHHRGRGGPERAHARRRPRGHARRRGLRAGGGRRRRGARSAGRRRPAARAPCQGGRHPGRPAARPRRGRRRPGRPGRRSRDRGLTSPPSTPWSGRRALARHRPAPAPHACRQL